MNFQIHALPNTEFDHLFDLSDAELKERNAHRETVRACPGTPCRVSMEDAQVGEQVIAINYTHQPQETAYQASHAIFIRKGAKKAEFAIDEVPELFRHRLISVRAFNDKHLMIDADAVMGSKLETAIAELFANPDADYIHLHYAKPGCFAAKVTRTS